MKHLLPAIALVLLATPPLQAAARSPERDPKLWEAAKAASAGQLQLLESMVNLDSGTGDVEGGRKVAALLVPRLQALGMDVQAVAAEAIGLPENIVATINGTGKGRILLIAHLDTVFGPGTVAKRPFSVAGTRALGPGVGDEKGGVVEGVYALELLKSMGVRDYARITFLVETSEERGSPGTRALIDRLLKDADVELNLEPGDAPDALTVWRKGSNSFYVDVKGRAAHAGVAPQDGRNAATELVHQVQALDAFPHSGDGLTVNLTIMNAGSRYNIIPEDASATFNVRIREASQAEAVQKALEASAAHPLVPDTRVTVRREISFPPLPDNAATSALADQATAIYAGLGLTIGRAGNGGASESALAYASGVAALDGLGPVGGNFHSDDEYIELGTLTPRLYLLTKLVMDLGHKPPPRIQP